MYAAMLSVTSRDSQWLQCLANGWLMVAVIKDCLELT